MAARSSTIAYHQMHTPPAIAPALLFEPSKFDSDAGHLIGRDPRSLPLALVQQLPHPQSPIRAIRAKCLDFSGGLAGEVRKCTAVACPLWPLRMGVNPFHGNRNHTGENLPKSGLSDEGMA